MISMKLSQAAKALNERFVGDDVIFNGCSTDSRNIKAGELFIALRGERFDGHDYLKQVADAGACAVMVEQPLDTEIPALLVNDTRKSMGKLAHAWRTQFDIPLVAVTGSNGKTTVKEMLASILSQHVQVLATKGNLNNDIGVPLTLFQLNEQHRFAVIEMGANHPGEIDWLSFIGKPEVAVITQCAPAHLEGFGSIQGVAEAKAEIYNGLKNDGIAVINADDNYADFWKEKTKQHKQITFGVDKDADVYAYSIEQSNNSIGKTFVLASSIGEIDISLKLAGQHNVANALAAASCAIALNIDLNEIKNGLEKMQAVQGRLQLKQGREGLTVLDDTYNANPTSLEAGIDVLQSFNKQSCLVLGDMGELGNDAIKLHAEVGKKIKAMGIKKFYAIGPLSLQAVKSFGVGGQHFTDMNSLIAVLQSELKQDFAILVKGSRTMHMERVIDALTEGDKEC